MFFLQQNSWKAIFYPAGRQRWQDRANHVRWGRNARRKIRFNLFSALYLKLLVPTYFAISGYPWQSGKTKWRWLATQDHAKLVYFWCRPVWAWCGMSELPSIPSRTKFFANIQVHWSRGPLNTVKAWRCYVRRVCCMTWCGVRQAQKYEKKQICCIKLSFYWHWVYQIYRRNPWWHIVRSLIDVVAGKQRGLC